MLTMQADAMALAVPPPSVGTNVSAVDREFAAEIEGDRKRLLLDSVRSTTVATIAAVGLVAVDFWGKVDPVLLLGWSALTLVIGVFRLAVVRRAGEGACGAQLEWSHRRTMAGTVLAALMWLAGLPLFYSNDGTGMMVPAFLYLILCCGGTVSLSVYRPAFLCFVPPIMAGVAGMFAFHAATVPEGRGDSATIVIGLLLMTAVLFRLMRQTDKQLTQTLTLNYQNGSLVGELKDAHHRAEDEKLRQVRRREGMEQLTARFEQRVGGLMSKASQASAMLIAKVDGTNALVHDTLEQASHVARVAQDVAERIHGLSAAAAELSESIALVDGDVHSAADIARQSVAELTDTNRIVQSLADASQRVGEIVGLIAVIAKQTNMLALNATIEAQRAGEAGRGFAVVAGEVKNLASQTARASCEVTEHIERIQVTTRNVTYAIRSIGETVLRVDGLAEKVVASVRAQGQTTNAISQDLNRVAGDTAAVTRSVVKLNQSASSAVAATEEMTVEANLLAASARETTQQIHEFLVGTRQQA